MSNRRLSRPLQSRRHFLAQWMATATVSTFVLPGASIAQPARESAPSPELLENLVAANRILARHGIVDAYGHVSARHDKNPERFFLSRSLAPELVTAEDLIEYDLDANPIHVAGRSQYSERFIHAQIYRARSDVNAVVHDHSPSVIPFGVTTAPMRPVYHMAGFIGEGLPIFDIREASGMTDMLVSDALRGKALADALGRSTAVLMRGHGVAVVGPTIPFAVARSIYLETNARIQLEAVNLGGEVRYLDPQEARKILEAGENRGYERPWELWKREALEAPSSPR